MSQTLVSQDTPTAAAAAAAFKAVIPRSDLAAALATVIGAAPSKTTLPVLAGVELTVQDDAEGPRLTLRCTDLDLTETHTIAIQEGTAGRVVIPAKKLNEIVRELANGPVTLTGKKSFKLEIRAGKAMFKIDGHPDEMPTSPRVGAALGKVPAGQLAALGKAVSFATSTEESRPILNGVLLEIRQSYLQAVATNGHRLMLAKIPMADGSLGAETRDVILPPKALQELERMIPADHEIEVAVSDNQIRFASPTTTIMSRLIEGPYPPYAQVIPKDNDIMTVVDKAAFVSLLTRMAVMASEQTHRVKITLGTEVKAEADTPDLGSGSDDFPAENHTGAPLTFGVNAAYLIELVKSIKTPTILLTGKTAERAIEIKAVGELPQGLSKLEGLVMPLRLMD